MKRQREDTDSQMTATATSTTTSLVTIRTTTTTLSSNTTINKVKQFFSCKDITTKILSIILKTSTPIVWLSVLLVCKDWNRILNCRTFWREMFQQKFVERMTLVTEEKYRSNASMFKTFSYLQRWACLTQQINVSNNIATTTISNNTITTSNYSKYGYFIDPNYGNDNTLLMEGQFCNGKLVQGICYIVNCEIQEGQFDSEGLFVSGDFEIWNPPLDGWTRFVGVCNPHNGWRDEGTAFWNDGMTYCGYFKRYDRHGFGYMSNAKGEITCSGVWRNDVLIIPEFLLNWD